MKNKIKNISIIVLVILNLITSIWIIRIYHTQPTAILVWQDCVPDANSAATIAQVVYNSYFGELFEKEYFECVEGDTQWQVYLKSFDASENAMVCMDGGVFINKKDGAIIKAEISKAEIDEFYKLHNF